MGARTKGRLKATILAGLVLAIGATYAAPAQAAPLFTADSYPATIDGVAAAPAIFQFGGVYAWECETAPMQGTLAGASSALTLSVTYETCRWRYPVTEPPQPWSAVLIAMNGCDWKLQSLQKLEADKYKSSANLECPAGKDVVIELQQGGFPLCKLTVQAQSNKSEVRLSDKTEKSPNDVEALIAIAGLKYTQELGFPYSCPVKTGTYENLNYQGIATLTATSAGKQIGFRVTGE